MTIKYDAVVIGAGFSGLYMLHKLRARGLSAKVYEVADDVGGVWYWSRYPGARCDSESMYYSFMFSEELYKKWKWSERFSPQDEILKYLRFVAEELDLRKDIQFETRINLAHFDDDKKVWKIETNKGEQIEAKYFISGVGCLSTTNMPPFEGTETFKGEQYHTGRWPHEKVDFTGKKVVMIGNGSSGVQSAPVIAEEAEKLTLLMRTPHYVAEARNRPLTEEDHQYAYGNFEYIKSAFRDTPLGFHLYTTGKTVAEVDEDERKRQLDHVWEIGSLGVGTVFTDIVLNEDANFVLAQYIRDKIDEIVEDPEVAKLLHPDYYVGSKRLIIGTNYYEMFNRDNVELVPIKNNPIQKIVENGIQLEDGVVECDVIVYATGYDAMTGSLLRIDIRGRGGQTLAEKWNNGRSVKTYLGITVEKFPNFFMITGPQSPSVLTNMPSSIEQHVNWIDDCIGYMEENNLQLFEATEQAELSWCKQCDDIANMTLYPHTDSWYTGANVDGEKRGFVIFVGGIDNYTKICDDIAANGYEGFNFETVDSNVALQ